MKYPKETTVEEREQTELAAEIGQENMPGGKPVKVDLMKRAKAANREAEDQMGASGPRSETH